MLKLLLCIVSAAVLAMVLLQMRQQHLNLSHQINRLHATIQSKQGELWNEQLQIASYTAPNAITRTVGQHDLKLVSPNPLPAKTANWIAATDNATD